MTSTVILGLGSNLTNPLQQCRRAWRKLQAFNELEVLAVSPVYTSTALLPNDAPAHWQKPYLNVTCRCTTTLSPRHLLDRLKTLEQQLGRVSAERWAPRLIDIDILAWDDLVYQDDQLTLPHPELIKRPFALLPLLDVHPNWEHPSVSLSSIPWLKNGISAPYQTKRLEQPLKSPSLVGIINVTPDSFSDGGLYQAPKAALAQAKKLVDAGAEIIDIGAESTRPGASLLSPNEEWLRLCPVLEQLTPWPFPGFQPQISIDTRHTETVERALAFHPDWINDVSGAECKCIAPLLAGTALRYVMMHHLGIPHNADTVLDPKLDPIDTLISWAKEQYIYILRPRHR